MAKERDKVSPSLAVEEFLQKQRFLAAFTLEGQLRHSYLKVEEYLGPIREALEQEADSPGIKGKENPGEAWIRLRSLAALQASRVLIEVWGREGEYNLSTKLYLVKELGEAYIGNKIPGSGQNDPSIEILGPNQSTIGEMRRSSLLLVFGAQAAAYAIACEAVGQERPWPEIIDGLVGEHVARSISNKAFYGRDDVTWPAPDSEAV